MRKRFAQFLKWFRLKKLQREFRRSEEFQKKCEQLECRHLANLEERYRNGIAEEIKRLK